MSTDYSISIKYFNYTPFVARLFVAYQNIKRLNRINLCVPKRKLFKLMTHMNYLVEQLELLFGTGIISCCCDDAQLPEYHQSSATSFLASRRAAT